MQKILVVGSTNIDFVISVEEMPKTGETILSKRYTRVPGGKGANQAYACGMLGGKAEFLTVIGNDGLGEIVMQNMRSAGVCIDRVETCEETGTGIAIITVNREGDNSIIVISAANSYCDMDYLERNAAALEACDILLVQLETPIEAIYELIRRAHRLGKTVILNPAPCPERIPDEILSLVQLITPNETELQKLTGCGLETEEALFAGGRALLDKGVEQVLVTLGSKGAMLCTAHGYKLFDAYPVGTVDTTAAGDTFNAAIAVGLAEGAPLANAIRFANAASALAVSRPGARTSVPRREEVEEFIGSIGEDA